MAPSQAPPAFVAAATARYRVTFDATWSALTHPDEAPPNPHWSGLIGGTHRDTVRFWREGGIASDGVKAMAERGNKTPLDTEVQAAIQAGTAQHVLSGGALPGSPGTVSLDFEVSRDYPLVTLVSMVAPSPDWFVGVSGLSLFDGTDWVAERTVALQPWDAGTDAGASFPRRTGRSTRGCRSRASTRGPSWWAAACRRWARSRSAACPDRRRG
jgi:hypothetical protein